MTTSDRLAHLPKHNVTGPGVGPRLSRPMHSLELAEQLADRLDREHGIGTHRVNGQLAPAARAALADRAFDRAAMMAADGGMS